jgi:glyoxylase-like metal-dependent hydrolase (beta-lactamase superfamily II)
MTQRTSSLTRAMLAPNPGPMTLDGTNTYLVGGPGTPVVVVDPGPADDGHIAALVAAGPIELVLVTHHHADHTAASAQLHRITGVPVRALDPAQCHGGRSLADGELIEAGGTSIRVIATPGHTADSVCFHLPDDAALGVGRDSTNARGSLITGDTILGRGTTVLAPDDGALADYLRSLEGIRALGPITVLPGHGPVLADLAATTTALLTHRQRRLASVRAALETLGADATVQSVADAVYADVDPAVRFAAEASVAAQLAYLRGDLTFP